MISFSSVWNLLNFWRSVSSGYNTQIVMDVTHKCSTAAVNRHGIRVNMLAARQLRCHSLSSQLKLNPSQYTPRPTTPRHAEGSARSYGLRL